MTGGRSNTNTTRVDTDRQPEHPTTTTNHDDETRVDTERQPEHPTTTTNDDDDVATINELAEVFETMISLALKSDSEKNAKLIRLRDQLRSALASLCSVRRLHFVVGGLVSSGKTTLINAWMCHLISGVRGALFESHLLENTKFVSEVQCSSDVPKFCIEPVTYKRNTAIGDDDAYFTRSVGEKTEFESIDALKKGIREYQMPENAPATHLSVKIPTKESAQWLVLPNQDMMHWPFSSFTTVDAPGVDSMCVQGQIVTYLKDKYFLFVYLVDLTKPDPFGMQGFEILAYLAKELGPHFPPVIVFTKWEELCDKFNNPKWKRAHGMTNTEVEDIVKELMATTAKKLKQAGIVNMPYFAGINAFETVIHSAGMESEGCQAREDFVEFIHNISLLGKDVAEPLRVLKCVSGVLQATQEVANTILEDMEDARLLSMPAMEKLHQVRLKIIADYNHKVDHYFENVTWTYRGVVERQPPTPFDKTNCAISMIPDLICRSFDEYKAAHPEIENKFIATESIATTAMEQFTKKLAENMNVYEEDGLREFYSYLMTLMKGSLQRFKNEAVELSLVEKAKGFCCIGAGVLFHVTGWGVNGMVWLVGGGTLSSFVFFPAIGSWLIIYGLNTLCKNYLGFWTWDECRCCVDDAVFKSLSSNSEKFKTHFKTDFKKKMDTLAAKTEACRIPVKVEKATQILGDGWKLVKKSEHMLGVKLGSARRLRENGYEDRWLGGDKNLQRVWNSVDWLQAMDME